MKAGRRVTARDISQAGSLQALVEKLVGHVETGNMEIKERGAMFLHSLTGQSDDNVAMLEQAGSIRPLVQLVNSGSTIAQVHACGALAAIGEKKLAYQQQIF